MKLHILGYVPIHSVNSALVQVGEAGQGELQARSMVSHPLFNARGRATH